VTLPRTDSGGRYAAFTYEIENLTQDTLILLWDTRDGDDFTNDGRTLGGQYWGRLSQAAYELADSIEITTTDDHVHYRSVRFAAPSKYRDTLFYHEYSRWLLFKVAPHHASPDLSIPAEFTAYRYTFNGNYDDTVAWTWNIEASDAATKKSGRLQVLITGLGACPGPMPQFPIGTLLSNATNPVDIGEPDSIQWDGTVADFDRAGEYTVFDSIFVSYVRFEVQGEYADRFVVGPPRTRRSGSYVPWVRFLGTQKGVVHDTLIGTYTNCWGTTVIRTPIEAYSSISNTHRISSISQIVAPFLGAASTKFMIANTSPFPFELQGRFEGLYPNAFTLAGPTVIEAHDSAEFVLTLHDNDQAADLVTNKREAELLLQIQLQGTDLICRDALTGITVEGGIDVYSTNYLTLPPKLQHGTHPKGIIFRTTDPPITVVFRNQDSVPRTLFSPFFDDTRFSIAVSGRLFPFTARPDTDMLVTQITYSDTDLTHSHLTRLRWPRDIDTISIDVLAWAADWKSDVRHQDVVNHLRLWPNPCSSVLRVDGIDLMHERYVICDLLGRTLRDK
jgi:hypothetical protein